MAYYPGAIDQYGRQWSRCTECGDSNNRNHAHMATYPDGGCYCFRCGHYHDSTSAEMMELLGNVAAFNDYQAASRYIELEPASKEPGRFTQLETYTGPNNNWDYFQLRNQLGYVVGWYGRHPHERQFDANGMGFGFPGTELVSTPSRPLILVEGPYDCINDQTVCVFGSLSYSRLKCLKLHTLWLWPDPDAIATRVQRIEFLNMMNKLNERLVIVEGVIVSNGDPDEATEHIHYRLEDKVKFLEGNFN